MTTSIIHAAPAPPLAGQAEGRASDAGGSHRGFDAYQEALIHSWAKVLTVLGVILFPSFAVLDFFTMPAELLSKFAWYRGAVAVEMLVHYVVLRRTRPSRYAYLHGYLISFVAGAMVVQMTKDLGGFSSAYYAGLNLVIVGVGLLFPWRALHSLVNSLIVLMMYLVYNGLFGAYFEASILVNNLYFLGAMIVVAVAITHTKHRLIEQEFHLRAELLDANERLDRSRQDLKAARDALWSEIEVAQRIQTALLPRNRRLGPYEVAGLMLPATEVGGDYYDMIETGAGERWVNIGDVSGHGVESGLVMMMTQTSILSTVSQEPGLAPSAVFRLVNNVLRENIARLNTSRYMTLNVVRLEPDRLVVAGKHQDLLVWRAATGQVETVVNHGCWIGMVADTQGLVDDLTLEMGAGDTLLLFTDGATEATSGDEMYGQERLSAAFARAATQPLDTALQALLQDVRRFADKLDDDVTLVLIRRVP